MTQSEIWGIVIGVVLSATNVGLLIAMLAIHIKENYK
jgi:hypothetical protein